MVSKKVFVVFIFPAIFSLFFGSAVMADILQKPGRELDFGSVSVSVPEKTPSPVVPKETPSKAVPKETPSKAVPKETPSKAVIVIEILGLSNQYSTSEPVEVQVKIGDSSFDCGDLYITVYSEDDSPIIQNQFLEQCFEDEDKIIPVGEGFSVLVDTPGYYEIEAEIISKELINVSTTEGFTVK